MHISLLGLEVVRCAVMCGELGAEETPPAPFPFLDNEGLLAPELFPTGDFFPREPRPRLGLAAPILIPGGTFRPSLAE